MDNLLSALKALKIWQITVLAAVLVGAAGAVYGTSVVMGKSGQPKLSTNQQLVPVKYGNLLNQVSTSGSLIFSNKQTLTFGTAGTVGEISVTEGQQVKQGQAMAKLDTATIASLDKAVAQARLNLQTAQEALDTAKSPYTSLQMAQAEAAVSNARLAANNAQTDLDTLKNSPTADDIAKAQAQVDSANVTLANAQSDLKLAQKNSAANLDTAQTTLSNATDAYKAVFAKWLGTSLSDSELKMSPATLLASWGLDLSALFDPSKRFQDTSQGLFSGGIPADDPATRVNETSLYAWLNFMPGSIVFTCDSDKAPPQGACIQKEMNDAWTVYQKALDNLDTVQTQSAKAVSSAQSAVARSQDSLATVQQALSDVKAGPDPLAVDAKTKQLAVAQATLAKAQDDLAQVKAGADPLNVALKEAEVASAKATLDIAVQRRDSAILKSPIDGVVSAVSVLSAQSVGANTTIVEVVDPSLVELDGVVDQIDVLFVKVGATAQVTMDALPGQVIQGTVSSLASTAQSQQGVVSYPVTIQLKPPSGVDLREGLSATANIVIRQENNVLLVPLQALYGTFDQPVVKVMSNGRAVDRSVVLGNSDDYWVAVQQGLAEGDQVVMEGQTTTAGQLNVGQAFRQFGQMSGAMPGGSFQGQGTTQQQNQARRTPTPRASR